MPVPPVRSLRELDASTREAVLALVKRARRSDGVRPLSEQSVLAVKGRSSHRPTHLLRYASDRLVGYAQLDDDDAAELVVDPSDRRQGVGSELLDNLPEDARIWAHGDLAAAEAFAAARSLEVVRELWKLGRRFADNPALAPVALPDGLVARSFEPGRDEAEWLRVNAAAFAHHPEQGRMSRSDLDARMAEDWFDPEGLKLVVLADDPDHVVASHWTKIPVPSPRREVNFGGVDAPTTHQSWPLARPTGRPAVGGEVYVVAVDPAYQGRGLGTPVTLLGLHHLQDRGVDDVVLYVDGDNPAALRLYRKLGFETRSVDRMYRRVHQRR